MQIEVFLKEHKNIGSERTRKSYQGFLPRYEAFLKRRGITEEQAHPSDIRDFIEELKSYYNFKSGENSMSDTTVQSHLAAVSSYYQWRRCREPDLINPVKGFKFRRSKPPRRIQPIGCALATAMARRAGSSVARAIIRVFRGSGLRLRELVALNKNSVTLYMGRRGSKRRLRGVVEVKGKGGRTRTVLLSNDAVLALRDYLLERRNDSEPALFLSSRKHRISMRTVQRMVLSAALRAGAPHGHPHQLRHLFATEATNRGYRENQLRKRLGHLDLGTTYKYIHLSDRDVCKSYARAMKKSSLSPKNRLRRILAKHRSRGK